MTRSNGKKGKSGVSGIADPFLRFSLAMLKRAQQDAESQDSNIDPVWGHEYLFCGDSVFHRYIQASFPHYELPTDGNRGVSI